MHNTLSINHETITKSYEVYKSSTDKNLLNFKNEIDTLKNMNINIKNENMKYKTNLQQIVNKVRDFITSNESNIEIMNIPGLFHACKVFYVSKFTELIDTINLRDLENIKEEYDRIRIKNAEIKRILILKVAELNEKLEDLRLAEEICNKYKIKDLKIRNLKRQVKKYKRRYLKTKEDNPSRSAKYEPELINIKSRSFNYDKSNSKKIRSRSSYDDDITQKRPFAYNQEDIKQNTNIDDNDKEETKQNNNKEDINKEDTKKSKSSPSESDMWECFK
ncbi:uncharacterized protein VNE69_11069 [Vairimorpha necatrix]